MNLVIANTAIRTDAEGRFCLNDLHKAAGGEKADGPSYWMTNQQTKALVAELQGDTGIPGGPTATLNDGKNNGTYVCKELVYAYAMWISPKFHLQVIRAYDAMTVKPEQPPANLSRLELIELAMQAEQERLALEDKANKLEAKVAEQAPKVAFAQQVEVAPDAIDLGKAAKLIGTGRTRLMAFMREIRWINRFNQPYQDKIEAGLLDVKVSPWEHPKHGLQQQITTLVFGKGLVKLQSLWNERQHAIGAAHMQPATTQPGSGVQA